MIGNGQSYASRLYLWFRIFFRSLYVTTAASQYEGCGFKDKNVQYCNNYMRLIVRSSTPSKEVERVFRDIFRQNNNNPQKHLTGKKFSAKFYVQKMKSYFGLATLTPTIYPSLKFLYIINCIMLS